MTDGGDEELLRVSTLGGLLIELRGERIDHLVPAKAAALVAYLADTGRPASRQLLAGLLWSDRPEENARASLRVTLNRLRRVLADRVVADRNEIRLVGPIDCDSRRLEDAAALDAAELYHGDFLAGQDFDGASLFAEWTRSRREHLRSVAVSALLEGIEERRERGDVDRVGELAARLVALEPWNESGQRHLIGALAETSGRAAALAQFQGYQDQLRVELGLEPEFETTELVEALYRDQQPAPAPSRPERGTIIGVRHQIAPLYGREREIELLAERVIHADHRLVSIVGPGGVGKTRLGLATAERVADRFPDGVVFAELAGVQTIADVTRLLVGLIDPDGTENGNDPLDRILQLLADRRLLVVLDNLEHLVAEGVELWSTLLRHSPGVHLLVTSREEVGVTGEDVIQLSGLAVPDEGNDDVAVSPAVRLFVERAYRADKTFVLGDHNRDTVVRLCRLVEGMPLHLELAAATTAQIPIDRVIELIAGHDSLAELAVGDRPLRHATFDAVFEHSWDLLDPHLQEVLSRLSVALGGFDLEGAEGAAGASPVDLARLQRKSLVARDGPDRYRLHELTRQAALRRMAADAAAMAKARDVHAAHHLGRVGAAYEPLNQEGGAAVVQELLADLDNLRQAWRHAVETGRADLLGTSVAGLGRLFGRAGRNVEGADLIGLAAEAMRTGMVEPDGDHDEAGLLVVRGELLMTRGPEATASALRVLELLADRPERTSDRARAHSVLCVESVALFDNAAARSHTEAVLAEVAGSDDLGLQALARVNAAMLESQQERPDRAVDHLVEAVALFEQVGDVTGQARALAWLAGTRSDRFELWGALEAARRSYRLYETLGDHSRMADLAVSMASVETKLGHYEAGAAHAAAAVEMYRRQDDYLEGLAQCRHGESLAGLGRRLEARSLFEEGIAGLRQRVGEYAAPLCYAFPRWARFLIEEGEVVEARLLAEELAAIAESNALAGDALVAEGLLARLGVIDRHELSLERARQVLTSPVRLWPVETLADWHAALVEVDPDGAAEVLEAARCLHLDTARAVLDPTIRTAYLTASGSATALHQAEAGSGGGW